jgi:hypothetical protein
MGFRYSATSETSSIGGNAGRRNSYAQQLEDKHLRSVHRIVIARAANGLVMNETEKKLLQALAKMAAQYLVQHVQDTELDSIAMGAGEHALTVLAEYGLVTLKGGHRIRGNWTEAGRSFLEKAWRA